MFKAFHSQNTSILAFTIILVFSIFLRFYQLGNVPGSLNRDEASLGYTAYSILQTGMEEHGVSWPIQIESFGDWKLPGYIYTLIPFIAVFGLEDWVVRLPSALSGVGISVVSYFFMNLILTSKHFFYSSPMNTKKARIISLLTFLLVSISPWAVHFSHVAYEAHLALFFFLLGNICFFSAQKTPWYFPVSAFFFGLTLFTYHSYQVFSPLMGLYLLFWQKNALVEKWKNSQNSRNSMVVSAIIVAVFGAVLLLSGSNTANTTKFSGLSIFSPSGYELQQVNQRILFSDMNSFLAKIYANKLVAPIFQFQNNVLKLFSPEFFFLSGGNNRSHNITGIGNFYPLSAVFLMIALLLSYVEKKPWQKFLLIWVVFAMIAPVITFESNHTTRFSPGFLPLTYLTAYGLFYFVSYVGKNTYFLKKFLMMGILIWGVYTIFHFLITYFVLFPKRDIDGWAWQYKKIAYLADAVSNEYDEIYMQGETSSPYIFLLYYLKIDPKTLNQDLEFYPPTDEGFRHVKRLGKYHFETIDWKENSVGSQKKLNIVLPREFPAHLVDNPHYQKEFSFDDAYSEYRYEFWSYTP